MCIYNDITHDYIKYKYNKYNIKCKAKQYIFIKPLSYTPLTTGTCIFQGNKLRGMACTVSPSNTFLDYLLAISPKYCFYFKLSAFYAQGALVFPKY